MATTDDKNENVISYNTADYNSDLIYDTNIKGKISSINLLFDKIMPIHSKNIKIRNS